MRWAALALWGLGCTSAAPALRTPTCTDAVSVVDHDVTLHVKLTPRSLEGAGVITVRAGCDTSTVTLDARALHVTAASVGGEPVRFSNDGHRLTLSLLHPLLRGETLPVALKWSASTTADTPRFLESQVWAGYSTEAWLPTRQDAAQRATLTLRVVAPTALEVAASGELQSVQHTSAFERTHVFVVDHPTPPFLYAFAAGAFAADEATVAGVTVRTLGPRHANLKLASSTTAAMLEHFVQVLGAPYPSSTYQQVLVDADAAQEAVGLALISVSALEDLVKDPTDDWVFAHELAHQWFGRSLACLDFGDFWLNEGFATYFVALSKEHNQGRSAYEAEVQHWRARSATVHAQHKDAPLSLFAPRAPRHALHDSELQPRGVTYFRGALVLHALRRELSDPTFFAALRTYVHDRTDHSVTTADLQRALEHVSGHSFEQFFKSWVYDTPDGASEHSPFAAPP